AAQRVSQPAAETHGWFHLGSWEILPRKPQIPYTAYWQILYDLGIIPHPPGATFQSPVPGVYEFERSWGTKAWAIVTAGSPEKMLAAYVAYNSAFKLKRNDAATKARFAEYDGKNYIPFSKEQIGPEPSLKDAVKTFDQFVSVEQFTVAE